MRYRKILLAAVALTFVVVFGLLVVARKGTDTRPLTVVYSNSHDVSLYDVTETVGDGSKKLIAKLANSGETKQLTKDHRYLITYTGKTGFSSGEITVNPADKEIKIDPPYSEDRLIALLKENMGVIHNTIRGKYRHIGLYQIQTGKLYGHGEWYGTTLKYIGNDVFNDDTLRLVLHNEGGVWVVKTDPPDITLSKIIFRDIPVDILKDVNRQQ